MNSPEPVSKVSLTLDQDQLVAQVADSLRKEDQAAAVATWRQLVKSLAESGSGVNEVSLSALIQQTLQRAGLQAEVAKPASSDAPKIEIQDLEEKLNTVGDDAQLANLDLQNMLQKQQQTLQMLSTISKLLHDTAMAVIRKIGG